MTNSIGSLSSSISQLFTRLDTKNQGYLEKSDFVSALANLGNSDNTSSIDDVFSALDSDSDGKVSESEFSSTLSKLQDQLDSQYNQMRLHGPGGGHGPHGMDGGMPPPPPADDAGFTQDELSSQLEEIGSSDSKRSAFISNVLDNFSAADSDGDGKVSFAEARALNNDSANANSTSNGASNTDARLMATIMQLMHAYGNFGGNQGNSTVSSQLSTSA